MPVPPPNTAEAVVVAAVPKGVEDVVMVAAPNKLVDDELVPPKGVEDAAVLATPNADDAVPNRDDDVVVTGFPKTDDELVDAAGEPKTDAVVAAAPPKTLEEAVTLGPPNSVEPVLPPNTEVVEADPPKTDAEEVSGVPVLPPNTDLAEAADPPKIDAAEVEGVPPNTEDAVVVGVPNKGCVGVDDKPKIDDLLPLKIEDAFEAAASETSVVAGADVEAPITEVAGVPKDDVAVVGADGVVIPGTEEAGLPKPDAAVVVDVLPNTDVKVDVVLTVDGWVEDDTVDWKEKKNKKKL